MEWATAGCFWGCLVVAAPDRVSDFHAVTIVALSLLSLSGYIGEYGRHVYTSMYFVATGFQMFHRRDYLKVAHHFISIVGMTLGLTERGGYWMGDGVKIGSRVMLIEASTPLLHAYKRSGSKTLAAAFALSFIGLRTFYLGRLAWSIWDPSSNVARFLAAQWCLNQIWTVQIIQKFIGGSFKSKTKASE